MHNSSESPGPAASERDLAPPGRWFACGAFAGGLFGAAYAYLASLLVELDTQVLLASALIGILLGSAFGVCYRTGKPKDSSLGTWIGIGAGLLPAILIFVSRIGLGRPMILLGVAATPVMAGLLVGGLLDRFFDALLFISTPDQDRSNLSQ